MKTNQTSWLLLMVGAAALTLATWHADQRQLSLPRQDLIKTSHFGEIVVARPDTTISGLSLIFADGQHYALDDLARRIAAQGSAVAVIDSVRALQALSADCQDFQDGTAIADPLKRLADWADVHSGVKRIVAGIGDGAWLAFVARNGNTADAYLSIGFSVKLADGAGHCAPSAAPEQNRVLQTPGAVFDKGRWRAIWTDQPEDDTAIFVRSVANAETVIAPYDTPLDQVAIGEIGRALGPSVLLTAPMPVVEVAAGRSNKVLTLFYSGDGGWRDLDRAVARVMADNDFPVSGVDALRYFWQRKSPEQTARDLSATMAYYREKAAVQSFVLAGYSFGADILPVVFNRLPKVDQDAVKLLVLLAPGEQADFEIHVSGWLGQKNGDMPLAPELAMLPADKLFCVYGREEMAVSACQRLRHSAAELLELPGGHHFDEDYPKLAQRIIETYRRHGIN